VHLLLTLIANALNQLLNKKDCSLLPFTQSCPATRYHGYCK
jgi:hypothetical protein